MRPFLLRPFGGSVKLALSGAVLEYRGYFASNTRRIVSVTTLGTADGLRCKSRSFTSASVRHTICTATKARVRTCGSQIQHSSLTQLLSRSHCPPATHQM